MTKGLILVTTGLFFCLYTKASMNPETAPANGVGERGGFQIGNGKGDRKIIQNPDALWKALAPKNWSSISRDSWTRITDPDERVLVDVDVLPVANLESNRDLVRRWIEEEGWALVKIGKLTAIQSVPKDTDRNTVTEIQVFKSRGEVLVLQIDARNSDKGEQVLDQVNYLLDSFELLTN